MCEMCKAADVMLVDENGSDRGLASMGRRLVDFSPHGRFLRLPELTVVCVSVFLR